SPAAGQSRPREITAAKPPAAGPGGDGGTASGTGPGAVPGTGPAPGSGAGDDHDALLRRLRELGELHRSGVLTDEEFTQAKQAVLRRM
ncbi:SHOCT domain-containing protein, partial [Streptomyces sp. AD55]|uniref:SHOCT domain-containing protein n=1 Tax=Streptomyces sp. AD55 TaxID=3242895 RepID=UPI00352984AE